MIAAAPLQRFIELRLGGVQLAAVAIERLRAQLVFLDGKDESDRLVKTFFESERISKTLLPELIQLAGIDAPKRQYFEIAAQFRPGEVHPEIIERLNQIKQAFGVGDV